MVYYFISQNTYKHLNPASTLGLWLYIKENYQFIFSYLLGGGRGNIGWLLVVLRDRNQASCKQSKACVPAHYIMCLVFGLER